MELWNATNGHDHERWERKMKVARWKKKKKKEWSPQKRVNNLSPAECTPCMRHKWCQLLWSSAFHEEMRYNEKILNQKSKQYNRTDTTIAHPASASGKAKNWMNYVCCRCHCRPPFPSHKHRDNLQPSNIWMFFARRFAFAARRKKVLNLWI